MLLYSLQLDASECCCHVAAQGPGWQASCASCTSWQSIPGGSARWSLTLTAASVTSSEQLLRQPTAG
jgi:hypothetical protein